MNGMARLYDAQTGEERRMEYLGELLTVRAAGIRQKGGEPANDSIQVRKRTGAESRDVVG